MATLQVFGTKDLTLLEKCITNAGDSKLIPYVCDPDMPFLCDEKLYV